MPQKLHAAPSQRNQDPATRILLDVRRGAEAMCRRWPSVGDIEREDAAAYAQDEALRVLGMGEAIPEPFAFGAKVAKGKLIKLRRRAERHVSAVVEPADSAEADGAESRIDGLRACARKGVDPSRLAESAKPATRILLDELGRKRIGEWFAAGAWRLAYRGPLDSDAAFRVLRTVPSMRAFCTPRRPVPARSPRLWVAAEAMAGAAPAGSPDLSIDAARAVLAAGLRALGLATGDFRGKAKAEVEKKARSHAGDYRFTVASMWRASSGRTLDAPAARRRQRRPKPWLLPFDAISRRPRNPSRRCRRSLRV